MRMQEIGVAWMYIFIQYTSSNLPLIITMFYILR